MAPRSTAALVGGVAAILLLAPESAAAAGGAVITPFSFTDTEVFQGAIPECSTDLVGTNTFTEVVSGQVVETPSGTVHASGTNLFSYRVDFPDGSYALGGGRSAFSFNAAGPFVSQSEVTREPRTLYDASGDPVVQVVIHVVSHLTWRDLDGDGQPGPGEITHTVDHFSFTCR
jgi:hypothetical protein